MQGALSGFASLLTNPDAGSVTGDRRALLVSDLHNNTLVLSSLSDYAQGQLLVNGTYGKPEIVVDGLRVAGFDDPMEYYGSNPDDPHRIFSFAQLPDRDRALADAQHRLLAWFNSLPQRPDVVEVHENGLVVLSPDWALSHTDCSSAVDYLDPREGPKTNAIHGARPISPLAPIAGARVP